MDEVVFEALRAAAPGRVLAIGITNQRETVVAWDARDGRPASNAIVWQDTRTAAECRAAIERGWEADVRARTGLPISTYFSATKIRWLFDNVAGGAGSSPRSGHLLLGTIDTWVIWNLTGGPRGGAHVTDPTNASRTLLCNLADLEWDPVLFERFGVPWEALPAIRPSIAREPYGFTRGGRPVRRARAGLRQPRGSAGGARGTGMLRGGRGEEHLRDGIVPARARRRQARRRAPTACCRRRPAPVRANAPTRSRARSRSSGAAVQWLRDSLGLIGSAAETEAIAASVPDSGGVYFVPAFSGLFAPHWDMRARGAIVGLTRFATRAHLVRATLEAICFQSREVADAMAADSGKPLSVLKVDGGASVERLSDAAPGRRAGRPRGAAGRERDDGPRRGVRGRPGGRERSRRPMRCGGSGRRTGRSSPRGPRTGASRHFAAGSGRSSGRGDGSRRAAAGLRMRTGPGDEGMADVDFDNPFRGPVMGTGHALRLITGQTGQKPLTGT